MDSLLLTASLLSLDGFAICLALGPLGPDTTRTLPLMFAICDGLASLIGPALAVPGVTTWAHELVPLTVASYGVLVLALAAHARPATRVGGLVYFLPVLLSVDNLVATPAIGTGVSAILASLTVGTVSGVAAFAGLRVGAIGAATWSRVPSPLFSGLGLLTVAAWFVLLA